MKIGIMNVAHPHAAAYFHSLGAFPEVEIVGVADEDPARGKHFAEQFGVRYFESYEALFAEKLDRVVVCAETAKRRTLVEMAARAGVDVLCENPLATSVEDAQAMVDACSQANVILMSAFPLRFSPPLGEVNRIISYKGLGKIYAVNATYQSVRPAEAWRMNKQMAGGGAIADHLVHVADYLRWVLDSEVSEVFAEANHIFHADGDIETGGLVSLSFTNGTIATVDCSWSKPANYPMNDGLLLEFLGEQGLVTVNAFKQVVTVYAERLQSPYTTYWGSNANDEMIIEFLYTIDEGSRPMVSFVEGYKAVEIMAAAYRSVESGQPVKL